MQQLHPDDVIWRNARLATMVPGESAPYGLKEQHALVARSTLLAVIPESDIPSGHITASISGASGDAGPD
jgi:imidazolonepropionase